MSAPIACPPTVRERDAQAEASPNWPTVEFLERLELPVQRWIIERVLPPTSAPLWWARHGHRGVGVDLRAAQPWTAIPQRAARFISLAQARDIVATYGLWAVELVDADRSWNRAPARCL
jgi:hypothetical protein